MPELVFKGKEYVYNHHLTVPYRPLTPDSAKSIGAADLSGNLIIHGDNLHALKSLLPRYAGKVDLIFIDPPYNTGNENWSYNDNVNSPIMKEWLKSNPVNADDMLKHDKWLCMMWPRLTLLKELLAETGSIWMTLDDNEIHRARSIFDEIFGAESFVATVAWQARYSVSNDTAISNSHNYVMVYSRVAETWKNIRNKVERSEDQSSQYSNPDNDPEGPWRAIPWDAPNVRENLSYPIKTPKGSIRLPPKGRHWSREERHWQDIVDSGLAYFGKNQDGAPSFKRYLKDAETVVPTTWWPHEVAGHTDEASKELAEFGLDTEFATPKPTRLLERIISIASKPDSLILDSFAGSATTAHAVLSCNARDEGTRNFILVESEEYANKLTAERVRRVVEGYSFSGTHREELLNEKITFTQLKKAGDWLKKVEAIKVKEGFGEEDDQMELGADAPNSDKAHNKTRRFDKIEVKMDDGVLRVEGVRKISDRMPGLGGEFTYCTLGDPIDAEAILSGKSLPSYEGLAAWLFYTATGATMVKSKVKPGEYFIGEAQDKLVWLIYKPSLDFLNSPEAALTLSFAKSLAQRHTGRKHLVFGPAKFLSNKQLMEYGVEFAHLPFALYREA